MPDQVDKTQEPKKEVKEHKATAAPTLGSVIANHLDSVMFDRKNMQNMEQAVDKWLQQHYHHTDTSRKEFTDQMMNARLCMESLYSRVIQQL